MSNKDCQRGMIVPRQHPFICASSGRHQAILTWIDGSRLTVVEVTSLVVGHNTTNADDSYPDAEYDSEVDV